MTSSEKVRTVRPTMLRTFSRSLLIIGLVLLAGCGTAPTTYPEFSSVEEMTRAAEKGNPAAMFEMGSHLLAGNEGTKPDLARARDWFERAAAKGEPRAEFNLGVLAHNGEGGMPKDFAVARQWFERAAAKDDMRSIFNLGAMEYAGEGGEKNLERARELFTKAAKGGVPEAMFNLGLMAAKGQGGEMDVVTAYAWFQLANERGNATAGEALRAVEKSLKPDELSMLKKASNDIKDSLLAK